MNACLNQRTDGFNEEMTALHSRSIYIMSMYLKTRIRLQFTHQKRPDAETAMTLRQNRLRKKIASLLKQGGDAGTACAEGASGGRDIPDAQIPRVGRLSRRHP